MSELILAGQTYSVGKLNALQQGNLARRLAPLVPHLAPVLIKMHADTVAQNKEVDTDVVAGLMGSFGPFANALSAMPDADFESLVALCMTAVQRKQDTGWAAVWSASGRTFMFVDIDLGVMLPLVIAVVRENLGNFIRGLLSDLIAVAAPTSTP